MDLGILFIGTSSYYRYSVFKNLVTIYSTGCFIGFLNKMVGLQPRITPLKANGWKSKKLMVWVSVIFLFGAFYQVQNGSFFSNFLGSRISLYQPTGVHNPHCFMLVSTSPDAPRKHRENPGNGRISEKLDEANLLINPPCQGEMKGIERQHANYLLNHKYSCCCCCCCWWWWWMRFPIYEVIQSRKQTTVLEV